METHWWETGCWRWKKNKSNYERQPKI